MWPNLVPRGRGTAGILDRGPARRACQLPGPWAARPRGHDSRSRRLPGPGWAGDPGAAPPSPQCPNSILPRGQGPLCPAWLGVTFHPRPRVPLPGGRGQLRRCRPEGGSGWESLAFRRPKGQPSSGSPRIPVCRGMG